MLFRIWAVIYRNGLQLHVWAGHPHFLEAKSEELAEQGKSYEDDEKAVKLAEELMKELDEEITDDEARAQKRSKGKRKRVIHRATKLKVKRQS